MPIWMKESAGEPYMPSNGTEGECFHSMWCEKCARDKLMNGSLTIDEADKDPDAYCEVLGRSFREDAIPEWLFSLEGWPTCTAFVAMGEKIPPPRCDHTADMFGATTEDKTP